MSVNGLGTPYSALIANQTRVDVAANNVANVNTDGFRALTVATTDNAYINDIGTGTRVAATYAPPRPAPIAPDAASTGVNSDTVTRSETTELSNTDLVNEMTSMRAAQNAYGANTAMMRTADEMSQTLMDIRR